MADSERSAESKESPRSGGLGVYPIRDEDLPAVASFLGRFYPPDTSQEEWADAWRTTVNLPDALAPNHGMLLRDGDTVVGAYPAIYSVRNIQGRSERFCNLAVWCVAPEYRTGGVRMLKALLNQGGFHFTDLTPIKPVQKLNERLGFKYLNTDTALVPNLPWPTVPGRTRILSDPAEMDASLAGEVRTVYRDHARCRWAKHLVLVNRGTACYVQWRVERRKGLSWFASIRYVSDHETFRTSFHALSRHLLLHQRVPFSLVEVRVAGGRIVPSLMLPNLYRRMFKSSSLHQEQIDYLYSEISSAP